MNLCIQLCVAYMNYCTHCAMPAWWKLIPLKPIAQFYKLIDIYRWQVWTNVFSSEPWKSISPFWSINKYVFNIEQLVISSVLWPGNSAGGKSLIINRKSTEVAILSMNKSQSYWTSKCHCQPVSIAYITTKRGLYDLYLIMNVLVTFSRPKLLIWWAIVLQTCIALI